MELNFDTMESEDGVYHILRRSDGVFLGVDVLHLILDLCHTPEAIKTLMRVLVALHNQYPPGIDA